MQHMDIVNENIQQEFAIKECEKLQILNNQKPNDWKFLYDVFMEVLRARQKFPSSRLVLAALTEEVGELAQAMLKNAAGKWGQERIWEEAVQTAAMALRCAIEGDPTFKGDYKEPEKCMWCNGTRVDNRTNQTCVPCHGKGFLE